MKQAMVPALLILNLCLTGALVIDRFYPDETEDWAQRSEQSAVSYTYKAELVRVIDGDTVVFDIDLGFETWLRNQTIRLYGIDTPEIRGTEKEEGLAVKAWLEELLQDQDIILQSIQDKKGKFGRWLGVLFVGDVNVNDELLRTNLAEKL